MTLGSSGPPSHRRLSGASPYHASLPAIVGPELLRFSPELMVTKSPSRSGIAGAHSLTLEMSRTSPMTPTGARANPVRRPRVLFVSSTCYDIPLSVGLARKWDAVERELDLRVIGRAGAVEGDDPRFRLIGAPLRALRGAAFYASLPVVVAAEIRRFRPHVVITQSPYEAFACLVRGPGTARPKLVVEVHGDWRTASRLYGSPLRRTYAALADRAALFALRGADATRAISPFTAKLVEEATGRKPVAIYPTYFDLESFIAEPPRPLPEEPAVAWIGALERTKNPRLLADAWRIAAPQVPRARLVVVGRGRLKPVIDELVRELPTRVRAIPQLEPREVARLLDDSTLLTLSSESEGFGRVILEAFARGRPVVATAVGGIPDLVKSEVKGLVVEPGSPEQLAGAIVRVLTDRDLADRLARGAVQGAQQAQWSPQGWAKAVRDLVDRVLGASR
jgi:glycosyltransferase involved in cell wall biosynthesis